MKEFIDYIKKTLKDCSEKATIPSEISNRVPNFKKFAEEFVCPYCDAPEYIQMLKLDRIDKTNIYFCSSCSRTWSIKLNLKTGKPVCFELDDEYYNLHLKNYKP